MPDIRVIEPKGMQVLDELLAEDEIDTEEINKQLRLLSEHVVQIKDLRRKYISISTPLRPLPLVIYQAQQRICTMEFLIRWMRFWIFTMMEEELVTD